jgi:hypothetical protein
MLSLFVGHSRVRCILVDEMLRGKYPDYGMTAEGMYSESSYLFSVIGHIWSHHNTQRLELVNHIRTSMHLHPWTVQLEWNVWQEPLKIFRHLLMNTILKCQGINKHCTHHCGGRHWYNRSTRDIHNINLRM